MYTASFAFFEALWEAGVRNVFVNLGSDHPSIIEAIVKGQSEKPDEFPKIYTCPNEMVALSMADGYARFTGKPQCVIVHVDVGTQGLGAAVHNAACGRAPVLIFAGLSPYTLDGEHRGSRTEYIHWIQDVPDQKQIVAQYCRYTGEIKTGANVKQLVRRALQFATTAPCGPVYLYGAREAMESEIQPYRLRDELWDGVGPAALPVEAVQAISSALVEAKEPLVITGYSGRDHACPQALVELANTVKGLRVLDTGGSDMCFPASHRGSLGLRYGVHPAIRTADFILVLDCDIPWIPTHNKPSTSCRVFHIDVDPLKQQMPVFYIEAESRWRADARTAIEQITSHIKNTASFSQYILSQSFSNRWDTLGVSHAQRLASIAQAADPPADGSLSTALLCATLRRVVPEDTIFAIEAVTNTGDVADQLQPSLPGTWINCGGGGLGWSGGGALGISLASSERLRSGRPPLVVQVVGDGTFLFSVPGSVYWIAERYQIPVLTVVLNNEGWNAPRKSLLLVHPDGLASRVDNKALNISFAPTPDYAGIAKAATGGKLLALQAVDAKGAEGVLKEAVGVVMAGGRAVVDAHLGGSEGKYLARAVGGEAKLEGLGKETDMDEGKSVG